MFLGLVTVTIPLAATAVQPCNSLSVNVPNAVLIDASVTSPLSLVSSSATWAATLLLAFAVAVASFALSSCVVKIGMLIATKMPFEIPSPRCFLNCLSCSAHSLQAHQSRCLIPRDITFSPFPLIAHNAITGAKPMMAFLLIFAAHSECGYAVFRMGCLSS